MLLNSFEERKKESTSWSVSVECMTLAISQEHFTLILVCLCRILNSVFVCQCVRFTLDCYISVYVGCFNLGCFMSVYEERFTIGCCITDKVECLTLGCSVSAYVEYFTLRCFMTVYVSLFLYV